MQTAACEIAECSRLSGLARFGVLAGRIAEKFSFSSPVARFYGIKNDVDVFGIRAGIPNNAFRDLGGNFCFLVVVLAFKPTYAHNGPIGIPRL